MSLLELWGASEDQCLAATHCWVFYSAAFCVKLFSSAVFSASKQQNRESPPASDGEWDREHDETIISSLRCLSDKNNINLCKTFDELASSTLSDHLLCCDAAQLVESFSFTHVFVAVVLSDTVMNKTQLFNQFKSLPVRICQMYCDVDVTCVNYKQKTLHIIITLCLEIKFL